MGDVLGTINQTLSNSPLPELIEKLGMAITQAQAALDKNSLNTLKEMSSHKMLINNKEYNLLSLGFTPTFYGFTEASIEAKMAFSMSEETSFGIGGKVTVDTKVVAVTVDASYARKFEQSAEGSSSIAAKLVALPPPDKLLEVLKEQNDKRIIGIESFEIKNPPTQMQIGDIKQLELEYIPENATDPKFEWIIQGSNGVEATINATGLLQIVKVIDKTDPDNSSLVTVSLGCASKTNVNLPQKTATIIIN